MKTVDDNVREDALIVRAESLAAWRDGERFLEQARQEAERIRSEALGQAQSLREQARQEGYENGRRAAMDDAGALALRLAAEREAYLADLEPRLVQVLDTAFRKILDGMAHTELIVLAARKAVSELRETGRFTLRVAPGVVAQLGQDDLQRLGSLVVMQEDETLRDAQCFLETPAGIIDLTPNAQWERILRILRQDGSEEA